MAERFLPGESPHHAAIESPHHVLGPPDKQINVGESTYYAGQTIPFEGSDFDPGDIMFVFSVLTFQTWSAAADGSGNATVPAYFFDGIGIKPFETNGDPELWNITINPVPLTLHCPAALAFMNAIYSGDPGNIAPPPASDALLGSLGYDSDIWNSSPLTASHLSLPLEIRGGWTPLHPGWIADRRVVHAFLSTTSGPVDTVWWKDDDLYGPLCPLGTYSLLDDPTGLAPAGVIVTA